MYFYSYREHTTFLKHLYLSFTRSHIFYIYITIISSPVAIISFYTLCISATSPGFTLGFKSWIILCLSWLLSQTHYIFPPPLNFLLWYFFLILSSILLFLFSRFISLPRLHFFSFSILHPILSLFSFAILLRFLQNFSFWLFLHSVLIRTLFLRLIQCIPLTELDPLSIIVP